MCSLIKIVGTPSTHDCYYSMKYGTFLNMKQLLAHPLTHRLTSMLMKVHEEQPLSNPYEARGMDPCWKGHKW